MKIAKTSRDHSRKVVWRHQVLVGIYYICVHLTPSTFAHVSQLGMDKKANTSAARSEICTLLIARSVWKPAAHRGRNQVRSSALIVVGVVLTTDMLQSRCCLSSPDYQLLLPVAPTEITELAQSNTSPYYRHESAPVANDRVCGYHIAKVHTEIPYPILKNFNPILASP